MDSSVGKGVREKVRRAHMHRKDFERRVHRFVRSNAYTVEGRDDLEAGNREWVVRVHRQPPLVRWGALMGECLFDFRSALDHLALDLAVAHIGSPLPPEVEERSEFPIFWKGPPSDRDLEWKIGAVHPEARDLIETMQPYGRTDRAALKYLASLHNFDKHRTLHLVTGASRGMAWYGEMEFSFTNFRPFSDGDVLARVALSDRRSDTDPVFTFGVRFSETGPGAAAPDAVTTLDWIGQHIEKGVIQPLARFL